MGYEGTLVIFLYLTDFLLVTNGQLQLQLPLPVLGRQRVCSPYIPLPVNYSYDLDQCRREMSAAKRLRDPEADKRTAKIVIEHGYSLETHSVTSEDGYILTLYRVPGKRKYPRGEMKPAVMLYHGLGGCSDEWFVLPSNKNLVFKLVDAGYDVWLANGRGSDVSQRHVRFNAKEDLAYWDFTFHEMGIYDLPVTVDFILDVTGNEKLFYIGHSQGGTIYLVGASEVPELNDKIHASFLFAPSAYLGHAYMASVTALLPILYNPLEGIVYNWFKGRWEIRSPEGLLSFLGIMPIEMCSIRAVQCDLCDNAFFTLFDFNPSQANYTNSAHILKLLNTANIKSYFHMGQNLLSCKFRKYDYGPVENFRRYLSRKPPPYPLQNIQAPLHIYYGEQDSLVPPPDILRLAKDINPTALHGLHRVDDDTFEHTDFAVARDADKLVYAGLINLMDEYVKNSTFKSLNK